MEQGKKGFSYFLTEEQIKEYSRWPIERRLKWLYLVNKMRKGLPEKTIKIQELFRQGKV